MKYRGSAGTVRNGRFPKIAIACPGIGLVQRGFERFFMDLFQVVRHDFDVTLFKGGGIRSENEKRPLFVQRNGWLVRMLPAHKLFHRTPLHSECMTFALAMLPYLCTGGFEVVHTIDPPLTRLLFRMRARLGLRFKLLYTEGCAMPPSDYPPADHTQHVSKATFDEAVAFGHATDLMTLLPCGFYAERFATSRDRLALRRAYGIAEDDFVILSVAALNRSHKRIDYLIDEAALLDRKFVLWLDGSLDHGDPGLLDYARQRLGERCRITHVASEKIGELYRLADVLAHVATFESFGLAIVEAAACGLPLIIHDGPHFRWLIPNSECWVDMRRPGALSAKLAEVMRDPARRAAMRCTDPTQQRFSWHWLRPEYADLYRRLAARPARSVHESDCRRAG